MICRSILVSSLVVLEIGCSGDVQGPLAAPTASAVAEHQAQQAVATAGKESIPTPVEASPADECEEQQAQEFLQRAHLNHAAKSRTEREEMLRTRANAIAYRTAQYGYFEGFGDRKQNRRSPAEQSKSTTFFGIPVVMHERVILALKCVERRILRDCTDAPYKPSNLSGLRRRNTYIDGEVSNHVYGIAIDVDPLKNPCCKCLEPWSSSERCRGKKSVWQRMAMPKCWVDTFERYGFYWLGHDVLEDTMHFEFLGDPSRISSQQNGAPLAAK